MMTLRRKVREFCGDPMAVLPFWTLAEMLALNGANSRAEAEADDLPSPPPPKRLLRSVKL